MKIVFLIIDYVPHQILSIKTLIEENGAKVLAYHVGRFNQHVPEDLQNFSSSYYQDNSKEQILQEILSFKPDAVVTAGWMIPEYNWICKKIKKKGDMPVVALSDTPWYGTLKQKINAVISPFHVKRAFTHLWVAGIRQYDYARRLGFTNEQIIFNSLSADSTRFAQVDIEKKKNDFPKNFLYIGRYTEAKGLRNLVQAWAEIPDKKGWTFTLVGAGEMADELRANKDLIVKDYMSQELLLAEMQNAGCFVLPSLHEPWALVIHEAAAAGLPIVCTETCGAAAHFVINHYNGYKVKDNSVDHLRKRLFDVMNLNEEALLTFSRNSRELSESINPELLAANLIQILYNGE